MKAFVIKNKDGYYLVNTFAWSKKLIHAYIDESEKDLEIVLKKCKDCTIVPITICEGDLEEENRVLKKALELACGETDNYWNEQNALEKKMTLYDYFIQQAKESEKDEYIDN